MPILAGQVLLRNCLLIRKKSRRQKQSWRQGSLLIPLLLLSLLGVARSVQAAQQLDVPYVPTPYEVVDRMLEMAEVNPEDYLIDLGSGDGRIVINAVRDHKVRTALGIDLDPQRVAEARAHAREENVADRATFEQGDLFKKDVSQATVLTMYLLPEVNLRLRPVVLDMAPGTRIVSHAFNMGDWEADQFDTIGTSNIYLWIVPAQVAGRWRLTASDGRQMILSLTQNYQRIEGVAEIDGSTERLSDARLKGDQIRFTLGADTYSGRIEDGAIASLDEDGTVKGWNARRFK